MAGPTTPDPALANAAAALEQQLLALDGALDGQLFDASSSDGTITARASASGDLVLLTISAKLLTPATGLGLSAALLPVLNAAIAKGQAKARADLALLAAGFSLPGLPADPPDLPDIPAFGEAVSIFRGQMDALEGAATSAPHYVGRAADGKVEVEVNGLLNVTAITLDPSLFSSVDASATAGFIQQAVNLALRTARHDVACQETDAAAATVALGAVIVYVGYLDNEHGTRNPAETPTPFDPDTNMILSPGTVAIPHDTGVIRFDANIILISTGGIATPHDTGVIRFENRTDGPVTIDPRLLRVTTEEKTFQIWNRVLPITLAPGQNLVLAETKNFNFDTSDAGLGRDPVVRGRVNGKDFEFTDAARVLLGREDAGKRDRNESTPYQVLGRIEVPVPAQTLIMAKHSGKVLEVKGASTRNGAAIIQRDWHGGEHQLFRLEQVGGGYFRLVAKHSGKVLEVKGASTRNGATIIQRDWKGGDNQRFRLEPLGDGYARVVTKHSGKVLEVKGASIRNGAAIIQWDWHGGDNQQWLVRPP